MIKGTFHQEVMTVKNISETKNKSSKRMEQNTTRITRRKCNSAVI